MSLRAIVRDYGNQISIFAFGAKSCEKETLGRNLIFQSNRTTTDYSDSASILHNANFLEFYYSGSLALANFSGEVFTCVHFQKKI